MGLIDEFRSGNFSLYGQWFGLFSVIALILFGILSFTPIWSIVGWIIAFLLIFVEIPLCLKCCPTSAKFDNFLGKFQNSVVRAVGYIA
ncbi:hypothetical protein B0O80DRAFT_435393 [Mortierella sp. GBAus27b]|nr:hypothetical protein B0O80DRAFT_435393 [Mortierella sp. GBAus27b]